MSNIRINENENTCIIGSSQHGSVRFLCASSNQEASWPLAPGPGVFECNVRLWRLTSGSLCPVLHAARRAGRGPVQRVKFEAY